MTIPVEKIDAGKDLLDLYQAWVHRMWNWQDGHETPPPFTLRDDYLMCLGLGGETGEVLEILKKAERKHKPVDLLHLGEELGDVLYYLVIIASRYKLNFAEILAQNVLKLEERKQSKLKELKDSQPEKTK